jgi:hypothetical protein
MVVGAPAAGDRPYVMSSRRIVQLTVIVAITGLACAWVAIGLMSEGLGDAAARTAVVLVVVPSVLYVALGPPLFGFIASLLLPEPELPRFGYCPRCDYDLRGNNDPSRCPECGTEIPVELRGHGGTT